MIPLVNVVKKAGGDFPIVGVARTGIIIHLESIVSTTYTHSHLPAAVVGTAIKTRSPAFANGHAIGCAAGTGPTFQSKWGFNSQRRRETGNKRVTVYIVTAATAEGNRWIWVARNSSSLTKSNIGCISGRIPGIAQNTKAAIVGLHVCRSRGIGFCQRPVAGRIDAKNIS